MKGTIVSLAIATILLSAAPAASQSGRQGPAITPYTGYMIFGDILRGPVGSSLANANGATFGAQLSLPLAGPISLYGNAAFARSDLTIGVPILGGLGIASADTWLFDGGIEIRLPSGSAVTPVVQAGAGGARYTISNGFLRTDATNATGVLGAGLDVAVTPSVGLRLLARDYIGRFDLREAIFANVEGRTSHHIGLTAGLRLSF